MLASAPSSVAATTQPLSRTTFDDLTIDFLARRVWIAGSEVVLRAKEFDLLARLLADVGHAVTRETLMADVWDEHWFGSTKTLDFHISALRRKIDRTCHGQSDHHVARHRVSVRAPMRRRILIAILSIAGLAIVLFAVPLAIVVERFVDEEAMLRVERQAILAARVVPEDFATRTDPVELPSNSVGIQLGLYDSRGTLVSRERPDQRGQRDQRCSRKPRHRQRNRSVLASSPSQCRPTKRSSARSAPSSRPLAATPEPRGSFFSLARWRSAWWPSGLASVTSSPGGSPDPCASLRDAAVRLGDGDFTIDVPRSDIPEIDQAAVAMTATAARLDDLVARERSFSADVSHQLRTPLAGLRAAIETELEFPRPDHTVVLRESLDDIERLERTILELLAIARSSQPNGSPVSIAADPRRDQRCVAWPFRAGRPAADDRRRA